MTFTITLRLPQCTAVFWRMLTRCLCPGVDVKTWKVQMVDDGLEENHESFNLTLRTPHNAVLGQRTSASVEILDPRGGVPAWGATYPHPHHHHPGGPAGGAVPHSPTQILFLIHVSTPSRTLPPPGPAAEGPASTS